MSYWFYTVCERERTAELLKRGQEEQGYKAYVSMIDGYYVVYTTNHDARHD